VETEKKELTREKRIEDLQAEYDRRKERSKASRDQLTELMQGLKQMDVLKAKEIEETSDGLPDASPQLFVQKVLQLPNQARAQLLSNIDKVKVAIEIEERKAKQAYDQKQALIRAIREDEINGLTRAAFAELEETIRLVQLAENQLYGKAIPSIESAYDADQRFHDVNGRAGRLGLNPVLSHVIDSHIKQGETGNVSLDAVVEAVRGIGDYYGKGVALLGKVYRSTFREHPLTDNSYFGFAKSERTD